MERFREYERYRSDSTYNKKLKKVHLLTASDTKIKNGLFVKEVLKVEKKNNLRKQIPEIDETRTYSRVSLPLHYTRKYQTLKIKRENY